MKYVNIVFACHMYYKMLYDYEKVIVIHSSSSDHATVKKKERNIFYHMTACIMYRSVLNHLIRLQNNCQSVSV